MECLGPVSYFVCMCANDAFIGWCGIILPLPQQLELSIQVGVPCTAQQGEFRAVPEKEACRDWECAQTSGLLDCIKAEGISTIGTEILTFVAFLFA